jgi:starvation-inducible DNA-binding protein
MVESTTSTSAARAPGNGSQLYRTKNDLPEEVRTRVIDRLNQRLADCIDLQTQCKQAHWNVKGPTFIALHELFDQIDEAVEGYADLIAERIVQLGGVAEGTARMVAGRSSLEEYPSRLAAGEEHVDALSTALATFGRLVRADIGEMNELDDDDSEDILIEISRGIDKWLWFVEAHEQAELGAPAEAVRSGGGGEGPARGAGRPRPAPAGRRQATSRRAASRGQRVSG